MTKGKMLFLTLMAVLVLSACNASGTEEVEGASSGQKGSVAVGGSTSGSTAFAYSVVVSNLNSQENEDLNMQIQETAGTVDGVRQLIEGGVDVAVSASGTTIDAINGDGPFAATGQTEDLRMLWNLYPSPFNIVVDANSDIDSPEDFVGKSVGAGAPGSGSYIMLIDLLEAYGVDPEELDIQALTPEEQDAAFRDGHLDVMTFQAGPKTAWLMDLSRTRDLKWLTVSEEEFDKIASSKPEGYYAYSEIPSNSYEGQAEAVGTIAANIEWVTTSDLSEDTVYQITKAFWDNKDQADDMHTIIAQNPAEYAFGATTTEWHPGVIKYLEENGIEYKKFSE